MDFLIIVGIIAAVAAAVYLSSRKKPHQPNPLPPEPPEKAPWPIDDRR